MAVGDAGALYLMENGYPNFLSLTYGVPKLSEIEELENISQDLQDQKDAIFEDVCNSVFELCKKCKKQRKMIKKAGEYIDQSDTISAEDKENLKRILHID